MAIELLVASSRSWSIRDRAALPPAAARVGRRSLRRFTDLQVFAKSAVTRRAAVIFPGPKRGGHARRHRAR